jgi:hypothetical protein
VAAQSRLRSVLFDVEPLVALWDTHETVLRAGVETVVTAMAAVQGVLVVGFATNSLRDLDVTDRGDLDVFYPTAAHKPLSTSYYRDLPQPAGPVGDQIATDGVLARRLGFAFAHVQYTNYPPPRGPRLMRRLGKPLRPWLCSAE